MNSQVVCISGASSGIGQATAEAYAEKGFRLALGARRTDRLQALKASLLTKGAASVFTAELDVRTEHSVKSWAKSVIQEFGQIDILINNAGLVLGLESIEAGNETDWTTILDTNVLGVLRLSKAFIPQMKKQGSGQIILVGSIAGHQAYEGGGAYCASKFGVKALTQTLNLELNGSSIRVGSVDPGMVETEFSLVRFRGDSEKATQVYRGLTPLHARDVAECITFMTSRPKHVNIQNIVVMPTDQATVYKTFRKEN